VELFKAVQNVVEPDGRRLYMRLPLHRGGLAIDQRELPDLPESKARVLTDAGRLDTQRFENALVQTAPSDYVLDGSAAAEFGVQKEPRELILRAGE
jgi:hypothetical protein